MKNIVIILSVFLFANIGFSQAPPQGINYQAVVYSDNGNNQPGLNVPGQLLLNQAIRVRFTIIANAANGTEVYKETHATTTDAFGMFSLIIGQGAQESSNSFAVIDWGTGKHFLKVEIDKSGGTNYITMSNQQLWSVPYALYSQHAATADSSTTSANATTADFATNSAHADSSDYADLAGNGITGVTDNGDGTLTFIYLDGSSYTTAVLNGLTGPQGPAGAYGLSAYEVWLAQGNIGTEQDFLNSLQGATGAPGPQGIPGSPGQNGVNGANGQNGLSAYDIWLAQGNTGTQQDFLNSLTGLQGANGLSAYDIWLSQGNTGTEQDFLNSIIGSQGLQGDNGINGQSAYDLWIAQGNTGTVADFLNSLVGTNGSQGPQGPIGPQGPAGANGNGFQNGTALGQVMYWDGSTWILLNPGSQAQILTLCNGVPTWTTGGICPGTGTITALNCGGSTNSGILQSGVAASGVSSSITYTGGNGGSHNGQTVASTGVTGLTATLAPGNFATGSGNLVYTISGTPNSSGTASFALNIGGQTCTLTRTVNLPVGTITALSCGTATNTGTLTSGTAASSVSSSVPYTGGNGGAHNGQTVISTGVTGLTANLAVGTFANGAGNLTYTITGTPNSSGTASFAINIGGQICNLTWSVNLPIGTITALSCGTATNAGTLTSGTAASGVSSSVPYTGGNGGTHNGQIVSSTGVNGLTATLAAGNFATGAGTLNYTITGTPSTSGTASFTLNIGGQTCTLSLMVAYNLASQYAAGSVFCASGPTAIVDVTNPTTGKTWMDRNLGASQVAGWSTNSPAYGDLYQWGRNSDGHQCRNSFITSTMSSNDQPSNGYFIDPANSPADWRSPQNNNLWQGVNGINNPCPSGYRLPTEMEFEAERLSWSSNNTNGAFSSPLKLPVAGYRFYNGSLTNVGFECRYWSSTVNMTQARGLVCSGANQPAQMENSPRAYGYSVRCIKN